MGVVALVVGVARAAENATDWSSLCGKARTVTV